MHRLPTPLCHARRHTLQCFSALCSTCMSALSRSVMCRLLLSHAASLPPIGRISCSCGIRTRIFLCAFVYYAHLHILINSQAPKATLPARHTSAASPATSMSPASSTSPATAAMKAHVMTCMAAPHHTSCCCCAPLHASRSFTPREHLASISASSLLHLASSSTSCALHQPCC
jgi:hypothetical protein